MEITQFSKQVQDNGDIWLYDDNYPVFIIEIDELSDCSVTGQVYEVESWVDDNEPLDKEQYMRFYIKWDGCSHVNFGERDGTDCRDGYLHLCGKGCWERHVALMSWLYEWEGAEIPIRE